LPFLQTTLLPWQYVPDYIIIDVQKTIEVCFTHQLIPYKNPQFHQTSNSPNNLRPTQLVTGHTIFKSAF